ncbi:hypothetical protein [Methylocapsa aurea]|uniref:hypothetical protein n=1 Tax=Methylocapsa aurea TaxID=663610 RepID=UPI00055D0FA9|nr:hypothetical protein [Methylocapsa aurea]
MISSRTAAAIIGAFFGAMALPGSVSAGSLGSVDGLPFFGHPYPYGYVYRRPPVECYDIHYVDTPDGPRLEEVWICGTPVTARY